MHHRYHEGITAKFVLTASVCVFLYTAGSAKAREAGSGSGTYVYVVQKNDTLYGIGRKFGADAKTLAQKNNLRDPNMIRPGQTLIVPGKDHAQGTRSRIQGPADLPSAPQYELAQAPPVFDDEPVSEPAPPPVLHYEHGHDESASTARGRDFIGAGFGWWFGFIEAEAQVSLGGIIGTDVDLVDDLGADDTTGIPVINGWLRPLSWLKFQGEYMKLDIDGSKTISEEIVFAGETFSFSDTVRSELEVDRFSGWVEINPFNGPWGYVGLSVGGEYLNVEGTLSADTVGSVSDTLDTGTATLGAQLALNLTEQLQIHARGRGMSFEISDVDVEVFDIQGGLTWTLAGHFQLSASYRYLSVDLEQDDDRGEITVQGPVVAASIKI